MKKIRILHIAQAPGGVARYIEMLLRHLDKNQFENILVCSQDFDTSTFIPLTDDIKVVSMNRNIGPKDALVTIKLMKLIRQLNPDIIYCHSSKAGAVGRIAAIGTKIPVLYNAHGWAFNMKCSEKMKSFYAFVERLLSYFTDRIICISDFEKESALSRHIAPEKKLQVIFNGVEIEDIRTHCEQSTIQRADLHIPENVPVIGMIGRIAEQKAPDTFVQMAGHVLSEYPTAHFVIVGDGPQEDEIVALAKQLNISDRIHITGWVNNPNDYMSIFDIGVLLSRWEGFGLVLCEYMAAGIPVVSTRVDAIPNLIESGKNGLLVDMDNAQQAADAVCSILSDKQLRTNLIDNALEVVQNKFSIQRVAKQTELLCENIFS